MEARIEKITKHEGNNRVDKTSTARFASVTGGESIKRIRDLKEALSQVEEEEDRSRKVQVPSRKTESSRRRIKEVALHP